MELFTVAIICYKNFDFLYDAIDSVLNQNYDSIELIVSDDGSENFPATEVEEYILSKRSGNVVSFSVIHSEINRGTVRHLNYLIQAATGDYLVFLAGDDALYDKNVLSNYVSSFKEAPDNCNILFAQTAMYDHSLQLFQDYYTNSNTIKILTQPVDYDELFHMLCISACLPSTSTCFRKGFFTQYGLFNEDYFLIEDYPLHIRIAEERIPVYYNNFLAIKHRDGGISHGQVRSVSHSKILYYQDVQKCHDVVLQKLSNKQLDYKEQIKKNYSHQKVYNDYQQLGVTRSAFDKLRLFFLHPLFSIGFILVFLYEHFGKITAKLLIGITGCWIGYPVVVQAIKNVMHINTAVFVSVVATILEVMWAVLFLLYIIECIGWLIKKINTFPEWLIWTMSY